MNNCVSVYVHLFVVAKQPKFYQQIMDYRISEDDYRGATADNERVMTSWTNKLITSH